MQNKKSLSVPGSLANIIIQGLAQNVPYFWVPFYQLLVLKVP